MSSEAAIKLQGISKCYEIYDKPVDRLKQIVLGGRRKYYREFWALRDVSFEVAKGETVGVIGRNGSGKSTLLQIISGTLNPTGGSVSVTGRIAALLELGAGFNPEFTGRENVYLNAALMGISREQLDEQMDYLLEFAEIGDFIDQPVKTYSSGMFTRLAFSAAIIVRPDILIVDEALSVGDVFFQQKCFAKIREMQQSGMTLLFVSHDPSSIKLLCDRSILLDSGSIISMGESNRVLNDYVRSLSKLDMSPSEPVAEEAAKRGDGEAEYRYGEQTAEISEYGIYVDGARARAVPINSLCEIRMKANFHEGCESPVAAFYIKDKRGVEMYSGNTYYLGASIGRKLVGDEVIICFNQVMSLAPGEYTLSFGLSDYVGGVSRPLDRRYDCQSFSVVSDRQVIGLVDLQSKVTLHVVEALNG